MMDSPEKHLEALIASVCPSSGHWPYTESAELYIGYRPAGEKLDYASDRALRTTLTYDVVIAARRGPAAQRMEAMRYALYAALLAGGWRIVGDPGPESYIAAHELFLWPVTVSRSWLLDRATGEPVARMVTD